MPSPSTEHVNWLIHNISGEALILFLSKQQSFSQLIAGGYKLTPASIKIPPLSNRIINLLTNKHNANLLNKTISVFASTFSNENRLAVINFLGDDWFKKNWRLIFRYFKTSRELVVAMITTPEDSFMCRLAKRLICCHSIWNDEFYAKINDKLPQAFATILMPKALLLQLPKPQPTKISKHSPEEAILHNVALLEKEKQRTKELSEKLKNSERTVKELELEKTRISSKLKQLEETCQTRIQSLSEEYRMQLDSTIIQARADLLGINAEWLPVATKITNDVDNIEKATNEVLEQQKELDSRWGLQTDVQEQIDRLDGCYAKLLEASKVSIRCHNDIPKLLKAIREKRGELISRLNLRSSPIETSEFYTSMEITINNLLHSDETPEELKQIRNFLKKANDIDIIAKDELTNLLNLCDRRLKLWQNMSNAESAAREHKNRRVLAREKEFREGGILVLGNHLQELREVTLVVDAYNILNRSDYWKRFNDNNGWNNSRIRKELIDLTTRHLQRYVKEVQLVFDGDNPLLTTIERNGNIVVVFAQKFEEAHNADRYIIDYFKHAKKDGDKAWVVTEDFGIVNELRGYADAHVLVNAFNNFIGAQF